MANYTYTGTGGTWSTIWVAGGPVIDSTFTWNRNSGSSSYINLNANYTGPTAITFNNTSASGDVMNMSGAGAGATSTFVMTFDRDCTVATTWSGSQSDTSGSYWRNITRSTGSPTIYKNGNGFWSMRGPVGGTLAANFYVNGGYLVADSLTVPSDSNWLGTGWITFGGENTGVSLISSGASGTINNDMYIDVASVVLGRYIPTGGTFTATMTVGGTTYLRRVAAGGTNAKTLNCTGNPIVLASLGGGDAGFGRCGFTKAGASTLTINGAPASDANKMGGEVIVPFTGIGTVILGASAGTVFKFATLTGPDGNSNISFGPANYSLGNIAGAGPYYITNITGNRTVTVGYANADAIHTGPVFTAGVTTGYSTYLEKRGTHDLRLAPAADNSTQTAFTYVRETGSITTGASTALGGNSFWVDVLDTSAVILDSNLAKNNAVIYVTGAGNGTRGAIHAIGATTRTLSCASVDLRNAAAAFSAASGTTLNVSSTGAVTDGFATSGINKLDAGTVNFSASGYTYTGATAVRAGRLTFTGATLTNKAIQLYGGTLGNTVVGAGCSITVPASSTAELEATNSANTFTTATTIPATSTLQLTTEAVSGVRPVKAMGGSAVTVNGTLRITAGTIQKARMTYGANLTFAAYSTLKLG